MGLTWNEKKRCPRCGTSIPDQNDFCSAKCHNIHNDLPEEMDIYQANTILEQRGGKQT